MTPRLKDYCEINFGAEAGGGVETLIAQRDQRCMGDFFPAALAKLREAGFGAIVMGRRGINKSFFGGKLSYAISQKLSDAALWLVP